MLDGNALCRGPVRIVGQMLADRIIQRNCAGIDKLGGDPAYLKKVMDEDKG